MSTPCQLVINFIARPLKEMNKRFTNLISIIYRKMSRLNEYQVIGRNLPTESVPEPKLFRMRILLQTPLLPNQDIGISCKIA